MSLLSMQKPNCLISTPTLLFNVTSKPNENLTLKITLEKMLLFEDVIATKDHTSGSYPTRGKPIYFVTTETKIEGKCHTSLSLPFLPQQDRKCWPTKPLNFLQTSQHLSYLINLQ